MRRIVPRFKFVDNIPEEWQSLSPTALYFTSSATVMVATKDRTKISIVVSVIHELGHHVLEFFTASNRVHAAYDRTWNWLMS